MRSPSATHSSKQGRIDSQYWRIHLAVSLMTLLRSFSFCLLFLFSAVSAPALNPSQLVSQYGHTAWRIQDGYFGGPIRSLAQTPDGYLWVGTQNGLFRFDGVRFVPMTRLAGQQAIITSLLAARDGGLWIGTLNGLSHWVNSKLIHLNASYLESLVEDENGAIWFLYDYLPGMPPPPGRLCRVIGMDIRCYGTEDGIPDMRYVRLVTDTRGNLWLAGASAIVQWNTASHTSTVYTTKELQSNAREGQPGVVALAANPNGSMLVGMDFQGPGGGLQQLVGGVWKPFRMPGLDGTSLDVAALLFDREGSLWIGTSGQGTYRVHGPRVEHFGSAEGLTSDYGILQLFEDREGNLWVPTNNGLDLFREFRVTTFSQHHGLDVSEVDSVLALRDGAVLAGSDRALATLSKEGVSFVRTGKGLPGNQVTSLFEDHTGQLWVGIDNKLSLYKDGKFRWINRNDGSPTGMVTGITEDIENNIWIETLLNSARSLLRIHDFKVEEEFPAPKIPAARRVVADPKGGIWLGLLDGNLARVRNGQAEIFHYPGSGKTGADVQQLTITPDGAVLGATSFGLIGWKNGKQRILNARNGLPCDSVHAALTDEAGNLWVYAKCGLVEIAARTVQEWWENSDTIVQPSLVLDVFDGAQPNRASFPGVARSVDGRLWFANTAALQMIDPAHLAVNTAPLPQVHVEEVVADRKMYPVQQGVRIPPLTRDLEIDYTALSLAIPQKVRFRYKLEGRDKDWQDPGTRRQAFYTDLPPRNYKFHVIACSSNGVWSQEGATLNFSILPAWYQENWFRFLCVATALFVVWSIYRLRVRQVARGLRVRFDERLAERTRIARDLHDTLLQTIQGSKLIADNALDPDADPAGMPRAMKQLSAWLGRATQEGRAVLNSLRSSTEQRNDLADALQHAIEECRLHSPIEASFSVVGNAEETHPIVRDDIYRISYEAIRNACAHSKATRLEVGLDYSQDLSVRVRDNGVGIDSTTAEKGRSGHFGLQGMRERAARIGSKLTVVSSPNSGTEVTLVVPGRIVFRQAPQHSVKKIRTRSDGLSITSDPN
jgi:signal transduction histidine kinase/ligand-binding sensor domain-containing protein